MTELRSLLGVLNDDAAGAGLAPEPGVGQLDVLVDRVRQAGLPAEIEIDGEPRPLPAGLDVTVYRIVQEALTNALRYAHDARTLVHLTFEPGSCASRSSTTARRTPYACPDGSGRGLVGMRERAAHVGGRLEAGPRLGGGYAVRAWLPLDTRPASLCGGATRTATGMSPAPARPRRRRPGAHPRRLPDDPRGPARHRGRRRGGRRRGSGRIGAAPPSRRRPDGRPDAGLDGLEATSGSSSARRDREPRRLPHHRS